MNNHQYSYAELPAALPFLITPIIWGLAANLTGAALLLTIAAIGATVLIFDLKLGAMPVKKNLWLILPAVYFLVRGWRGNSYLWEQALSIGVCLLYNIFITANLNDKQKNLCLWAILGGGWLAACVAAGVRILEPSGRVDTVAMPNWNILAFHLTMLVPLALEKFFAAAAREERIAPGVMLATFLAAILWHQAIGSLIILCFVLIILLPKIMPGVTPAQTKRPRLIFLILGFALLVATIWANPKTITDRLHWQKTALAIFSDHWLWGSASEGGFLQLYPLYKQKDAAVINSRWAHNIFLQWAADWGLAGLLVLAFSFMAIKKRLKDPPPSLYALAGIVLMAGLWESSLDALPNLFACLGIICCCTQTTNAEKKLFPLVKSAVCALFLTITATSLQIALARYYAIRGALWLAAITLIPDAWQQGRHYLYRSLRWDHKNHYTWFDVARVEFAARDLNLLSFNKALVAQHKACRLSVGYLPYLRDLKLMRVIEAKKIQP